MYIHALDQKATETAKEEEEPRVFALHRSAPPLDFHRHFLPFHHCKDWILTRILTLSRLAIQNILPGSSYAETAGGDGQAKSGTHGKS